MTQELKDLTREMKEQSDAIDAHLKTIESQQMTIHDLEDRIAVLEKADPDMSIYADTMDTDATTEYENDRRQEADTLDTCVVLLLMISLLLVVALQTKPLSIEDL